MRAGRVKPLRWFSRYWVARRWLVQFDDIDGCGLADPVRAVISISPHLNRVVREKTLLHEVAHVYMPWHRKPPGQWRAEEAIAARIEEMRAALRSMGWRAPPLPRGFDAYLARCGRPRAAFHPAYLRGVDDEL